MRDFYGRECQCAACNMQKARDKEATEIWLKNVREWLELRKLAEPTAPQSQPAWPPRFHMAEMTPAEAAKFLRDLCEQTVRGSKDWDNMQAIFEQFITDAYKGGKASAEQNP